MSEQFAESPIPRGFIQGAADRALAAYSEEKKFNDARKQPSNIILNRLIKFGFTKFNGEAFKISKVDNMWDILESSPVSTENLKVHTVLCSCMKTTFGIIHDGWIVLSSQSKQLYDSDYLIFAKSDSHINYKSHDGKVKLIPNELAQKNTTYVSKVISYLSRTYEVTMCHKVMFQYNDNIYANACLGVVVDDQTAEHLSKLHDKLKPDEYKGRKPIDVADQIAFLKIEIGKTHLHFAELKKQFGEKYGNVVNGDYTIGSDNSLTIGFDTKKNVSMFNYLESTYDGYNLLLIYYTGDETGNLTIPGGKREWGETSRRCCLREFPEETRIFFEKHMHIHHSGISKYIDPDFCTYNSITVLHFMKLPRFHNLDVASNGNKINIISLLDLPPSEVYLSMLKKRIDILLKNKQLAMSLKSASDKEDRCLQQLSWEDFPLDDNIDFYAQFDLLMVGRMKKIAAKGFGKWSSIQKIVSDNIKFELMQIGQPSSVSRVRSGIMIKEFISNINMSEYDVVNTAKTIAQLIAAEIQEHTDRIEAKLAEELKNLKLMTLKKTSRPSSKTILKLTTDDYAKVQMYEAIIKAKRDQLQQDKLDAFDSRAELRFNAQQERHLKYRKETQEREEIEYMRYKYQSASSSSR
jgi:ADP-ribose pyrophosphatase YjhB (NUDIX family)